METLTIDRIALKKEAKRLLDKNMMAMIGFLLLYLLVMMICFIASFRFPNPLENLCVKNTRGGMPYLYLFDYTGYYGSTFTDNFIISALVGIAFVSFRYLVFASLSYPFTVCLWSIPFCIVKKIPFTWNTVLSPICTARYFIEYMIAGALRFTLVFLWCFLLYVAGVVASYRYSFMPLIFCQNHEFTAIEVLDKTKELTQDFKGSLFVLDLSFFGWVLFGICTCGIVLLYVVCYYMVSKALYYKTICQIKPYVTINTIKNE